ncbi:hypothetical protein HOLleu_23169 [Holothuria leucospilota]|uniref:Uncharacterized protein n=1 Tax=Holothuria leucospilota TaxID=206669 RepID=A0A9Q1H5C3_HOLLE|nr:hypothetical protein HOLleu_23169 [Holothuria leucospilota]
MKSKAEKEVLADLKNKISKIERFTLEKLEDLENRSRRKNLVFFGIPEADDRHCESLIKEDILHTMMDLSDIDIERELTGHPGVPETLVRKGLDQFMFDSVVIQIERRSCEQPPLS